MKNLCNRLLFYFCLFFLTVHLESEQYENVVEFINDPNPADQLTSSLSTLQNALDSLAQKVTTVPTVLSNFIKTLINSNVTPDIPSDLQDQFLREINRDYNYWHQNPYLGNETILRPDVNEYVPSKDAKELSNIAGEDLNLFLSKLSMGDNTTLLSRVVDAIVSRILRNNYGISFYYWSGYNFLINKEIMKGERNNSSMGDYINLLQFAEDKAQLKNIQEELVQNYKIHLMPRRADLYKAIAIFCRELSKNEELQDVISELKYNVKLSDKELNASASEILPRIVIYPASGKEQAQKALNIIYQLFKDFDGVNITPRFNEKITTLIYVAQGDADYKKPEYRQYFEMPDTVYYKSNFTGVDRDYHLTNPARI